ncbi:hypothetical protein QWY16_07445 [Planococcus shenhongbingii]|uniref:hypothetical protein n=1 Tax=Planococcus shenhongbingii TaxID=3058398 RepID=UPI002639A8FB|nr:hypothetical protein [Planococcus sp. N016]WKA59934.1 hypothetical protein QWY16_07445 [Planococcus sp. N016]
MNNGKPDKNSVCFLRIIHHCRDCFSVHDLEENGQYMTVPFFFVTENRKKLLQAGYPMQQADSLLKAFSITVIIKIGIFALFYSPKGGKKND